MLIFHSQQRAWQEQKSFSGTEIPPQGKEVSEAWRQGCLHSYQTVHPISTPNQACWDGAAKNMEMIFSCKLKPPQTPLAI